MSSSDCHQTISKQDARSLLPMAEEFSRVAKDLIHLLDERIKRKKDHISKVNVFLAGVSLPSRSHQLSIQAVDIGSTHVDVKGKGRSTRKMAWETQIPRRKGFII